MDALKTLKSTPRLRQIPVIFLANMDDMNLRVEEFGNGGDDFIQKPIHEELMKLKIRRQLYIGAHQQRHGTYEEVVPRSGGAAPSSRDHLPEVHPHP